MKQFHDIFKWGIEIEMEIPRQHPIELEENEETNLYFKNDGSLKQTKPDTRLTELISARPFASKEEEELFFSQMKRRLPNFKSESGEDIFSYYNMSCGTHIHFSFKELPDAYLWIFDTMDFEKLFFKRYVETFRSEKFLSRIGGNYCNTPLLKSAAGIQTDPSKIKKDLSAIKLVDFTLEGSKSNGRYRWLNFHSIGNGTGLEIRIFPFLQTYNGLEIVMRFTQDVLTEYYNQPKTQERLELIKMYEELIKENGLKYNKLNDMKRIVYDMLMQTSPAPHLISGEVRLLFASWLKKQPSLTSKVEKAI